MILSIRHTGIVVADLDAAIRFYVGLLGFKVTRRMYETGIVVDKMLDMKNVRVTTVKMAAPGGGVLELLYYHSHTSLPRRSEIFDSGISHIALTVDDVDAEYARLDVEGVEFLSSPQISGDCKVVFCTDTDGNVLELVEVL